MNVRIVNLHPGCENNALFLSRARRYFELNGHRAGGEREADLVFVGACVVTDWMRRRCEEAIAGAMHSHPLAHFVVFGCLAAFPGELQACLGGEAARIRFIPYGASAELDALVGARVPFETVHVSRLEGHRPYQPRMGPDDRYLLISQGCVNDCSYCSIRLAKGRVRSRPAEEIEADARELYDQGVRTVTLLADDCGSYGLDRDDDLPGLLGRICRIAPDLRIKLYTVFPALFLQYADRLAPFFAAGRIPYVCLPAQSASPRILDLMNRRYDPGRLADAVLRLRALDPGVFVYSHFIFAFPTETWEELAESVSFAGLFDHSVFIGYGGNRVTRAAALASRCDDADRQAKADYLGRLVAEGKLASFVVPYA
ncbi:MAG: radical SAM protein [Syntrophaceae bacterium]|nr:radical SAM protein [Syntrophaceae bacterium]